MQTLLKELSCQIFDNYSCQSCGTSLSKDSLWFDHICKKHPDVVNNLSCEEIMSEADVDIIFSIKTTKHYFSWHLSCVLPLSIHYIFYYIIPCTLSTMSLCMPMPYGSCNIRTLNLVTCILLRYTKINGNFCLPAERQQCRIIQPLRHLRLVLKLETISLRHQLSTSLCSRRSVNFKRKSCVSHVP